MDEYFKFKFWKEIISIGLVAFDCGNSMDRDLNAAINIKTFGATLLAY